MPKNTIIKNTVVEVNEDNLKNKIYEIRGRKVMLDSDLATIYGYATKDFNRQVKNNIKKFEGDDFMFRLTREELSLLSRCNFCTLNERSLAPNKTERGKNIKYLPYAFTEQGIYMLMTVLRGELAVKQSRALIIAFKTMKDYFLQSHILLDYRLSNVEEKLKNVIMRDEISPVLLDFNEFSERQEFLFMNGEPARADETYRKIYSKAKQSIYIFDDYIDIKTLRLLASARENMRIIIFSDNIYNQLHQSDYSDFRQEFPTLDVQFFKTSGILHDRFIVLDYATKNESVYHCGASSKDAGKTIATILEIKNSSIKKSMRAIVEALLKNPPLKLK